MSRTQRHSRFGPPCCRAFGLLCAAVLAATSAACTDLPTERAERDLEVGRVEVGGVRFEVHEGLAAVHHAAPGQLTLWAGAPIITVAARTKADAVREWMIDIHNAMHGALLSASESAGAIVIDPVDAGDLATRRRFRVELPPGADVELTLAPPGAATDQPYCFAVMSDVQDGVDEVADVLGRINAEPSVEFVLSAGDLTQGGAASEMERFQRELVGLAVPLFSTIGNHDAPPDTPWHDWFGRASFRFRYRGVQYSLVDSASATVAPLVYEQLERWLADGVSLVHVFTTHVPLIDPVGMRNGSFGSRAEAGKLLAMLSRGRVDVTFYGHIHSYYAFENAGIPAFISGGGGAFEERLDGIGRHFMVIDVDPARGITRTRVVRVDE